jgi:FSR family fosmidomycin resistance protein-like MFS transporter
MNARRGAIGLLAAGHLFTDINQGAMPALLPFLVAEYRYSYQQAAGLVFAATVLSSVMQPLFGHFVDRARAAWLMPAGILLSGLALALVGVAHDYWLMAAVLMLSGLGVAAFHPEAARSMHAASGLRQSTNMSVFSLGGSTGFALGPLLATGLMLAYGVRGSLLLIVPAAAMALVLASQLWRMPARPATLGHNPGAALAGQARPRDHWAPFSLLMGAVILRSIIFFGLNTFIALYWINVLGQPKATGGIILTTWLVFGLLGALIGGRLCDRYTVRRFGWWASLAMLPVLLAFVALRQPIPAAILVSLLGILYAAPAAGMLVLGQELLPNHIGVASGLTIGLSASVGGATAPLLGWVADHYGIPTALTALAVLPVLIALLMWSLPAGKPVVAADKPDKKTYADFAESADTGA